MTRAVAALLVCLSSLVSLVAQTNDGLPFEPPPGWRLRNDSPTGQITLYPPGIPSGKECGLVILPAQDVTVPAQSYLEQLIRNLSVANQTLRGPDFVDVGAFRVAVLVQQTPQRLIQYVALHVARWGTKGQAVLFVSTDADLFRLHSSAVQAMLTKVAVPAPSPGAMSQPPGAATRPQLPGRPQVLEAYRRPAQRTHVSLYGGTSAERVHYERIALLSNGVADFVRYHAAGLGADPEVVTATPNTLNGYYGTWRTQGNTVIVRRQRTLPEEVMTRENGNLRRGDEVWTPAPRVDGLRLSGVYAYRSDQHGSPMQYNFWLEFSPDGRFRTGGALTFFAVSDMTGRPKPPQNAVGTYEIRDWTIWFIVNGAPVWSCEFMPLGDDLRNLSTVLIDTMGFRKQ